MNKKIFNESWNGFERGSDSWCQEQVRLLTDLILDTVDVEGIRAVLNEMAHNNLQKASSFGGRILEHLFKLKWAKNPTQELIKDWKDDLRRAQDNLSDMFIDNDNKDLLTTYRVELVNRILKAGVGYYKRAARDYSDLRFGLKNLPTVNPFEPEELWELSAEELLEKL